MEAVAPIPDGTPAPLITCRCSERKSWFRIEDDTVLRWQVLEIAEWEELRECPSCGAVWLQTWPEELETLPILSRPVPAEARRLRDIRRAPTMRPFCLARIEEQLGRIKEERAPCKKIECEARRLQGSSYCLEHLIAEQFGRQLAVLERQSNKK